MARSSRAHGTCPAIPAGGYVGHVPRSQDRFRTAARQTRRAAAMPLSETAERCGIAERDLRTALAALPGRGACAQAVATAAARGVAAAGCVSQCPPPAARAAGFATVGTQSWSSDLGAASDVPVARGLARRVLCAVALREGHEGRNVAASNPGCSALMLVAVAGGDHWVVRQAALQHPDCPPSALAAVMGTPFDKVEEPDAIEAAVSNPALPEHLLAAATQRSDAIARQGAAFNPRCPADLVQEMTTDPAEGVRIGAVSNPNCPPDALAAIEQTEESLDVLSAAAANPNCESWLLGVFAQWDDANIRMSVLSNVSCPPELFREIVDTDPDVAGAAAARSPHADTELLEQIAYPDASQFLLRGVAQHSACGPGTLTRLAHHRSDRVRAAAATNPACPLETIISLTVDNDPGVKFAARARLHAVTAAPPPVR